jgi:hypothetical protein
MGALIRLVAGVPLAEAFAVVVPPVVVALAVVALLAVVATGAVVGAVVAALAVGAVVAAVVGEPDDEAVVGAGATLFVGEDEPRLHALNASASSRASRTEQRRVRIGGMMTLLLWW